MGLQQQHFYQYGGRTYKRAQEKNRQTLPHKINTHHTMRGVYAQQ